MSFNRKLSNKFNNYSKPNDNIKKTKFNVVIRIRPEDAGKEKENEDFSSDDLKKVIFPLGNRQIKVQKHFLEEKIFTFDRILSEESSQEEAFDYIAKNIIDNVVNGYNGTIMAYGQTGSGKSYTIFGKESSIDLPDNVSFIDENSGIIPRTIKYLFEKIRDEKSNEFMKYKISISFFQIYMEQITDLIPDINQEERKKDKENFNLKDNINIKLKAKKDIGEGLKIREDPHSGVYIQGLKQIQIDNQEQLLEIINYSAKNRVTTNTNMNINSSRSHAVLRILFEKRIYNDEIEENKTKLLSGLLTIVDLAGSENSKHTMDGIRLEETKYINSSLYHLGSVIKSLANNPKEASFRSSSLTRILQDCISGNSKTSICATISPFSMNYDETLTTLQFASRAVKIKLNTSINENIDLNKNKKSQVKKGLNINNYFNSLFQNDKLKKTHENMNSNQNFNSTNTTNNLSEKEFVLINKKFYSLILNLQQKLCEKELEIITINNENTKLKMKIEKLSNKKIK